jgi:hypothetical protein
VPAFEDVVRGELPVLVGPVDPRQEALPLLLLRQVDAAAVLLVTRPAA